MRHKSHVTWLESYGILRLASPDSNQVTCDLRLPHLVDLCLMIPLLSKHLMYDF